MSIFVFLKLKIKPLINLLLFTEEYLDYSQENNQNHSNLPPSITLNVEIVPQKQETVIISTEAARNMLIGESVIKGRFFESSDNTIY